MIVLKADKELNLTFQKLIKMMDVPVEWNGMFFVVGDYLILQGSVRSLFFNFDTKLVVTNIIELKAEEQMIAAVEQHPNVRDILNMVLYAFGKWGNIKGLRVDKDYVQLNRLFAQILGEFQVESQYGPEHFRFYKNKIRLTYEDVIEAVLSDEPEEILLPEEEEPQGLWHKLVWKKAVGSFLMRDTTLAERRRNRIGNNFYLAGYLCPKCGSQLYLAVYPEGREFQIETEEGAVRIARVYSCKKCCCMYTPRPKRLLVDGDVYKMDFERDETAYEDYQELLGRTAGRNVNTKYNEYVDKKMAMETEGTDPSTAQDEEQEITELIGHLPELSELELFRTMRKMEEGFYSDEGVRRLERAIRGEEEAEQGTEEDTEKDIEEDTEKDIERNTEKDIKRDTEKDTEEDTEKDRERHTEEDIERGIEKDRERHTEKDIERSIEKNIERDIEKDAEEGLKRDSEDEPHTEVESGEGVESGAGVETGAEGSGKPEKNVGRSTGMSHADLKKVKEHFAATAGKTREHSRTATGGSKEKTQNKTGKTVEKTSGIVQEETRSAKEITEWAEDAGKTFERNSQKRTEPVEKAKSSKNASSVGAMNPSGNSTPEESRTQSKYTASAGSGNASGYAAPTGRTGTPAAPERDRQNRQEELKRLTQVQRCVNQPGRKTREELVSLLDDIKKENISPDIVRPYLEQVENRIRAMDEKKIKEICGDVGRMDFEDASEAAKQLENGNFLPQLKFDALKELEQRMSKIKTEECGLLVSKLQNAFDEAGMTELKRCHFYPAKRVWQRLAEPEETAVFEGAVEHFANGIGKFEYPVLLVDRSKDESGKEGVLLTPENLYYSAWMTSYYIPVVDIASIEAVTGLLNRGIYVHQKNGSRTKLPLPAAHGDMEKFAKVLEDFVHYLQEKPFSRKESYLAKEKHDTICCYRCGYIYKGTGVCPRCGYKQNE